MLHKPAKDTSPKLADEHSRCSGLPLSGKWMRCSDPDLPVPQECLRWGWTFRPDNGCYYDQWRPRDLAQYSSSPDTPRQWIVFLGNSVLRGMFLAAADHLVNGTDGVFKDVSKCWGRVDIRFGHIRLTYVDFRAPIYTRWPLPTEEKNQIGCHGSRLVDNGFEWYDNSTRMVEHMFKEAEPPTSIVFDVYDQSPDHYRVWGSLVPIPQGWEGQLIVLYLRSLPAHSVHIPPTTQQQLVVLKEALGRPFHLIDSYDIVR